MKQTMTEKIVQSHAVGLAPGQTVRTGDIIRVRPFHILTHDNTGAVIPKFRSIGATKVADPAQPVFALDHDVQNRTPENLAKYQKIEAFAAEQGIVFHPAQMGIGHQLMMERGFVHPGTLVVASDSHSNMYGALAALGTPVVRTDAAAIWATGSTWWQVPRSVRILLKGHLRQGVTGKDVILTLCGLYNKDEVLNACLEFHGEGVASLSIDDRFTISNMTTEWGALAGWFPFDTTTAEWLRARAQHLAEMGLGHRLSEDMVSGWEANPPAPDADATYDAEIVLDLESVSPHIAGPDTVSVILPVEEAERRDIRIHKAYLLSCVNGRLSDLALAARVLRGRKVAAGVSLYVAAASTETQEEAQRQGIWKDLQDAGAIMLAPGCGACIGLGEGLLEAGEVGISATNRNFKGRMGSRDARCYLANPAVVAASAVAGRIAQPEPVVLLEPEKCLRSFEQKTEARSVEVLEGFPATIEGRVLLLPVDNLNTDGIYGKDVTYRDDLTPGQMATFAMANYDPGFQSLAGEGDILVAGRNFGTGSSREQAATSLKYRGIRMVIAASFSQTYLRNAFNNAFICLESPALHDAIRKTCSEAVARGEKTIPCGRMILDVKRAVARWEGTEYPVSPMGPAAQELILAGGLEALTRKDLGL